MKQSLESKPSVCLVHDWLVAMRGGEKVLEALVELYPNAPIYTLFMNKSRLSPLLQSRDIHCSFLQHLPKIEKYYRYLLPLFPVAAFFINVKKYDLVISSSHCVAKAVRPHSRALHICYCHTPMRYLWGFEEEYFGKFLEIFRKLIKVYFQYLRQWDVKTSKRVNFFIANSSNTAQKIQKLYQKKAAVIHPPVSEIPKEVRINENKGDYYLIVSALVQYKRVDLAIEAFNRLQLPLNIIGDGPIKRKLQGLVRFKNIKFEGWVDQKTLWERYTHCKALIFPGEEDFGIVPLEAQMFGKPVIGFGKGGITESVIPFRKNSDLAQCTGIFFEEATSDSLSNAVRASQNLEFIPEFIRLHAEKFGVRSFKEQMMSFTNNIS